MVDLHDEAQGSSGLRAQGLAANVYTPTKIKNPRDVIAGLAGGMEENT